MSRNLNQKLQRLKLKSKKGNANQKKIICPRHFEKGLAFLPD